MTGITRRSALLALAGGLLLPLAGCAPPPARRLTMACGEPGGRYLQFGELLRDAMHRRGSAALDLIETNGSTENLHLLGSGRADFAIVLADSAEEHPGDLAAIGRVYQNYLQCVVRAEGPVRTLGDLAGRPVSIGATGSGSSVTTRRLLAAVGMAPGGPAPRLSEHTLDGALRALESGTIDAFFWSGGIPTPKIEELDTVLPLSLLDLSPAMPGLDAAHPDQYLSTRVPLGVYSTPAPVPTIGIPNLLVARPELPDAVARALVDVLIEDAHDLVPEGTVGLQFLTPANLIDTGALSLHPAARREYRGRYG